MVGEGLRLRTQIFQSQYATIATRQTAEKKVCGEPVIAGENAPEILEPAEAALDGITSLVSLAIMPDTLFAAGFRILLRRGRNPAEFLMRPHQCLADAPSPPSICRPISAMAR